MLIAEDQLLKQISPNDIVVDVGGGMEPFYRANYVVDFIPYSKRVKTTKRPFFAKKHWYQIDICSKTLPFTDKSIDFVICSHTLEDIRDPIFVCKELSRIAKAGYIETPSRALESSFGIDPFPLGNLYPGLNHHRWFVEVVNNKLIFTAKTLYLTVFPEMAVNGRKDPVLSFFWKNKFSFEERILDWKEYLYDLARFKAEFEGKSYQELRKNIDRKLTRARIARKLQKLIGKSKPFDFGDSFTKYKK